MNFVIPGTGGRGGRLGKLLTDKLDLAGSVVVGFSLP